MEIEEVKKITRYDEYTVNEFVRGLVKTRSDVEKANEELAVRADNVSVKADELEVEMSEEELVKSEEELQSIKQDKEKIEQTLAKWETEKERIKSKLENKKQENENKINENQQKIQDFENEIQANEEKMQDLDKESEEYADLEKANNEISKKISRAKGNITRYEKKINNLIEMIGNLEEENILEGLKPPREIKTTPRTLTLNEKYKAYIDKKARETGYYSQARTPEEDKNFRKMDELARNLQKEGKAEEPAKVQENEEIASLEEQIKKSAERMKEYRDSGNFEQEAAEHAYYNSLVSRMNDLKAEKQPETEKEEVEEKAKSQESGEAASLEEQIKKSAERMKEYRDSGNFEQESAEHAYYNSLVSRMNDLKDKRTTEAKKEEQVEEITSLEEEIRKSAARMKEYRKTGNYNQEALEHAYYNNLISRMNDLKSKEPEKEQLVETVKEEKTEQEPEPVKTQQTQEKQPIEIVKEEKTEEKQSTEPVKTKAKPAKQPTETVRTQTTQVKQPTEKAKTEPVEAKQPTKTVKTQTTQAKQPSEATKTESVQEKQPAEPVKEESKQAEPKSEIKWNSKLTQDQIEELIADGIEPGDNEYNLYLWNHGINPFEDQMKQKQEATKAVPDQVLEKYKNDGFGKNAFGWYFNPWKDEFDKDYDPHNDPEYNEKLKEAKAEKTGRKVEVTDKVEKSDNTEKSKVEEKATKVSLWHRFINAIKKGIENVKRYIDNFNNKQLPEGKETEQEKEEYVAKANEVLKETLSNDRIFDAKSRAAMQGREEFLAGIHISKELREKIDAQEEVEEEVYIPEDVKAEMDKQETER